METEPQSQNLWYLIKFHKKLYWRQSRPEVEGYRPTFIEEALTRSCNCTFWLHPAREKWLTSLRNDLPQLFQGNISELATFKNSDLNGIKHLHLYSIISAQQNPTLALHPFLPSSCCLGCFLNIYSPPIYAFLFLPFHLLSHWYLHFYFSTLILVNKVTSESGLWQFQHYPADVNWHHGTAGSVMAAAPLQIHMY